MSSDDLTNSWMLNMTKIGYKSLQWFAKTIMPVVRDDILEIAGAIGEDWTELRTLWEDELERMKTVIEPAVEWVGELWE